MSKYVRSFLALAIAFFFALAPVLGLSSKIYASPTITAPTNLVLTTPSPTNQSPALSWDSVSDATSYNIYRDGGSTPIGSTATTTYTDTSALQGTDSYSVTAVNGDGESAVSNSVSDLYDTAAPIITYSLSPAPNSNGWNNTATTVSFNCSDPTSGIVITSCSSPVTVSSAGANQQVTGTAVDSAGNTASVTATLNVDTDAPTITVTVSQANGQPANAGGWYTSPVTVSYSCTDATSGIASCSPPQTEPADGQYTLTGSATDNAGNTATVNTTVLIDTTPPAVSSLLLGSRSPLATGVPTTINAMASDNFSGMARVEYYVGTDPGQGNGTPMSYNSSTETATASFGPFMTPGTYTVYVRCEDNAGNWSTTRSETFTVDSTVANVSLTPSSQIGTVGGTATFTATATDVSNNPVAGITVRYSVTGSMTTNGSCVTAGNGQCTFSYTGPQLPGADQVSAYADINNNGTQDQGEPSATAAMAWQLPSSSRGSNSATGAGVYTDANGHTIAFGFLADNTNRSGTITGTCTVVDITAGTIYRCTDASVLVVNGNMATIFGDASVNNQATTYRIDVAGNGASANQNSFSFLTQSGYSTSGTLGFGTVTVK